jgi:hypothetical protein
VGRNPHGPARLHGVDDTGTRPKRRGPGASGPVVGYQGIPDRHLGGTSRLDVAARYGTPDPRRCIDTYWMGRTSIYHVRFFGVGSAPHGEQLPGTGHALQFTLTPVLEFDSRADY